MLNRKEEMKQEIVVRKSGGIEKMLQTVQTPETPSKVLLPRIKVSKKSSTTFPQKRFTSQDKEKHKDLISWAFQRETGDRKETKKIKIVGDDIYFAPV